MLLRTMRRNLAFCFVALAFVVPSAAFSQPAERIYDGFESIVGMKRNVRDVVDVNRTPLFDNAPFLRLRKSDKLVRGKEDDSEGMGKPRGEARTWYYVLSEEKYYQLWTEEKAGKLLLSPAFYAAENCLCFDWDFSMANARALRELLPSKYIRSISSAEYSAIWNSVRKEFPEAVIMIGGSVISSDIHEDRILSFSGHVFAEFQGLAFDPGQNTIYKYTIRIGPEAFSIHGLPLLRGPRHVERYEFEGVHDGSGLPNASPPFDVDPEMAKIKKAEYDRMVRFQKLIDSVLCHAVPVPN
jgi:hypothetical protein